MKEWEYYMDRVKYYMDRVKYFTDERNKNNYESFNYELRMGKKIIKNVESGNDE